MVFSKDFREFVELLHLNEVKYLIVGGYAVAMYGYPRFTGDLDIWIERSDNNAQRILTTCNEFGLKSFGLTTDDFLNPESVIQIGQPPLRIDIITSLDGLTFEKAFLNKDVRSVDDINMNIIGLQDLKINKKATGRFKDLDDLENLE